MRFSFCVRECDGVVDAEDVDACAGSHLNACKVRRAHGAKTKRGPRSTFVLPHCVRGVFVPLFCRHVHALAVVGPAPGSRTWASFFDFARS